MAPALTVTLLPPEADAEAAGKLCRVLNVDAVAFVEVGASVTHQKTDRFHVKDNRTDGAIHMVQTIVIVDKRGEIIVDMGSPSLGKSAKTRDLLPLYIGSGEDAIKEDNNNLNDPQRKNKKASFSLIDETASDMIKNLKKAMAT